MVSHTLHPDGSESATVMFPWPYPLVDTDGAVVGDSKSGIGNPVPAVPIPFPAVPANPCIVGPLVNVTKLLDEGMDQLVRAACVPRETMNEEMKAMRREAEFMRRFVPPAPISDVDLDRSVASDPALQAWMQGPEPKKVMDEAAERNRLYWAQFTNEAPGLPTVERVDQDADCGATVITEGPKDASRGNHND
jgi:hypothetical protein